jgi:hypothetical protein
MKRILQAKSLTPLIDITYIRKTFDLCESDTNIKKILDIAIEHVELEHGIALHQRVWKIIHDNDFVVLEDAPITKIISITDGANKAIEPLQIKRANNIVSLQFREGIAVKITYESGHTSDSLPECLKQTILTRFMDVYLETMNGLEITQDRRIGTRYVSNVKFQ